MSDSAAQRWNLRLQNIAIIIAGLWGVYVFFFQEYLKPRAAPSHIAVDMNLRKGEVGDKSKQPDTSYAVIVAEVQVKNDGPQSLFNLAGIGLLYGYKLDQPVEPPGLVQRARRALSSKENSQVSQVAFLGAKDLVGVSDLSTPEMLQPAEVYKQDWLFYVLPDRYDYLELIVVVAQSLKDSEFDIDWDLSAQGDTLITRLYKIGYFGSRQQVPDDEVPQLSEKLREDLQLGIAERRSILYLK